MWSKNNKLRRFSGCLVLAVLLGLACLCMGGCGVDEIDISGYADEQITISGIGDEDVSLTIADLKALDCVSVSCESTSDKIGKVRATGPTLNTVLEEFDMSQADIESVRVYGKDKYDAKFDSRVLESSDVILAFGIDGEPLGEEDAPVRIVIPDSDSAYWVRMVTRLEIE